MLHRLPCNAVHGCSSSPGLASSPSSTFNPSTSNREISLLLDSSEKSDPSQHNPHCVHNVSVTDAGMDRCTENRRILATHGFHAKTRPPSLRKEIVSSTDLLRVQAYVAGPISWFGLRVFYDCSVHLSSHFFYQ